CAVLQGREAGLQDGPVGCRLEVLWAQGRVVAPALHGLEQFRAAGCQALADQRFLSQQLQGALVGEQYTLARIEHQDPGAHALQDQRVERLQIGDFFGALAGQLFTDPEAPRSEEHTSELQSRENLVCRLLLEKKKIIITKYLRSVVWLERFVIVVG